MVIFQNVSTQEQLLAVRHLFEEYAMSRQGDPALVCFRDEIDNLPGPYSPPQGGIILARDNEMAMGCVALRPLDRDVCEMKRLYVRPTFRSRGIGRSLATAVIRQAHALGYRLMRLDSIPSMIRAQCLYQSLGFEEIPAYRVNPNPGARFYELALIP